MPTNREELNAYYNKVNLLIDEYVEKWKIRPSQLRRYLKPGSENFNRFLEKNRLSDIAGGRTILMDVIDDRCAAEEDGIITFESFKLFESDDYKFESINHCLYKGINKATIEMEKNIADCFDTNLGDIDIIDSEKHQFNLRDWQGEDLSVVVYSEEDLDIIKYNLIEFFYNDIKSKVLQVTDNISLKLVDLISEESYNEKMEVLITDDSLIQIITDTLSSGYKFYSKSKDFYIWVS